MNGNQDEWIIKLNLAVSELIKKFNNIQDQVIDTKDAFDQLLFRINDLEVKLDNLRAQCATHNHPEKRYGGPHNPPPNTGRHEQSP